MGEMIKYIICELYKCTDKKLFSCQTFELLGKTYIKIIIKTVKGVRRKMIFGFIDSHAEAHGEILNNKNSKYVYLCQKIIGVNRLPKDTYEMVSTKYNELFRVKYENVKRRITLASAETEQKQKKRPKGDFYINYSLYFIEEEPKVLPKFADRRIFTLTTSTILS